MSRLSWPEAPRVNNAIYPDEYIDHWADRYVSAGWLYRGVTLMQFLARPEVYEHADRSAEPMPLLGRQRRVQKRLIDAELRAHALQSPRDGEPLDLVGFTQRAERGLGDLPRRNGAIFEPLHHHAHPRNQLADFAYKQGTRR